MWLGGVILPQNYEKRHHGGAAVSSYGSALLLLQVETLLEAVNTAAGINQLLLAGIEGMAVAADFHTDVSLGRTSLELVAASALDSGHLIVGMDTLFHFFSPRSRSLLFA